MQLKQLINLSKSTNVFPKTSKIAKTLTIGGLAIGAVAGIATAPASAVIITGGELTFTGGTNNLSTSFADPNSPPASFIVNYNQPAAVPTILAATGPEFSTLFPQSKPALVGAVISSPNTFTRVGNTNNYTLNNNLTFDFGTVSLNVGANSIFAAGSNNVGGTDLRLATNVGSFFLSGTDNTPIRTLDFSFGDTGLSGIGTYRISGSPTAIPQTGPIPVPEPFTIIGTLVGGTAAFRMRKKLMTAVNK